MEILPNTKEVLKKGIEMGLGFLKILGKIFCTLDNLNLMNHMDMERLHIIVMKRKRAIGKVFGTMESMKKEFLWILKEK